MLSSELKAIEFSGMRHNSLTDYMEIWVDGEVKYEMTLKDFVLFPDKWDKAYADVFGLHNVERIEK
jgi:hypothetical protein